MTDAKQGTRQRSENAKRHAGTAREPQGGEEEGIGLRGKVDQVGALLAKGLDLAEAGLGLGVTLVNRVGAAAQQQIFERMANQAASMADAATAAADPMMQPMPPEPAAPEAPPPGPAPEPFGITNRLPLMPGGAVRIGFSINNDSMESPKKIALSVEGFVGEAHGKRLNDADFGIRPAKKTIAPMDFDKFVLEGALPPKTPPDVYRGWVIVASDAELRIPVRLVVLSL